MRWSERTKRAREKNAAHEDAAEKRAAHAAHHMALEAEGQRLAEEQLRREGANRVFCPVCDGEGRLTPTRPSELTGHSDALPRIRSRI